jgi:hypothetical protein
MEIIRRTGLLDYFIYELLDYRNIDLFGKDFLNILFIGYLSSFKLYFTVDKLKGLRHKGLLHYLPLFVFHIAIYINRMLESSAAVITIDTISSFCLFTLIHRDLYK